MAHFVLTDAFVSLNAVDLSDHVKSVTVDYKADVQDDTTMGDTTHTRLGGLKDWNLSIEFAQDFAAAEVDATLFPLVGTSFAVIVRAVNVGGVSATNPNFTGTGILESYTPIGGSVGDLAMAPVSILGNGVLTRATV